jgi:hypothetical protein
VPVPALPVEQVDPARQTSSSSRPERQQGCPGAPQAAQTAFRQLVPEAVQRVAPPVSGQQGWPTPPHLAPAGPHDPASQVPAKPLPQALPAA